MQEYGTKGEQTNATAPLQWLAGVDNAKGRAVQSLKTRCSAGNRLLKMR